VCSVVESGSRSWFYCTDILLLSNDFIGMFLRLSFSECYHNLFLILIFFLGSATNFIIFVS
jgi:hypothetical protein